MAREHKSGGIGAQWPLPIKICVGSLTPASSVGGLETGTAVGIFFRPFEPRIGSDLPELV
jgi:hypothetical protein